ncbi:MAG: glycosyltransferase family 9 protein [Phycisphaerales bacterium]|nr:glycosyltransferase family 9 protein [Phycisphaerales bacterium]
MTPRWTVLHGGALGDLVLTIRLLLRLPRPEREAGVLLCSRIPLLRLHDANPPLAHVCPDAAGLNWLFRDDDEPAPEKLSDLVRGARVLNALSGPDHPLHRRLERLLPAALASIDPRPRGDCADHIVDQWQRDLAEQGVLFDSCRRRRIALHVQLAAHRVSAARDELVRFTGGSAQRICLIHPGSGGGAKCWPTAHFAAVSRRLTQSGWSVVFLIGHVERERWSDSSIRELAAVAPLIEPPDTGALATLLAAGDAYLGNDAGPTHLAALVGARTVALFGPTRPQRWRPLGPRVSVLVGKSAEPGWGIDPREVERILCET